MRRRPVVSGTMLAGGAALAYGIAEARRPRLVRHHLAVGSGAAPFSVLHVSDTHLRATDGWLVTWLQGLPAALGDVPDLVVATGDLINDDSGIEPAVAALGALAARYGLYYVLGSHDYYQARFKGYAKYFRRGRRLPDMPRAATHELEAGLKAAGWISLTNATELVDTSAGRVRLAGMDDPYLGLHDTGHLRRARDDALAVAVVHAPDVVSECALGGFDLILAGHTHGGQVRIPLVGALVTNCSLPAALAVGPHRVGGAWLHVSPGLGTSRYAPIRINCPPEATILQLVPSLS